MSLVEAWANTLIGYWISIGAQTIIFPLFGINVSFTQSMEIGVMFLVVSVTRGYWLRRMFNYIHRRYG